LVVGNNLILRSFELVIIHRYYPIYNIPLEEMGGCTTISPSFAILLQSLVVVVGGNATISSAELAFSRAFERSLKPDQTRLPMPRVRVFRGYKSPYPDPYPR
jgi:hypothetical protein